VRSGKAYLLNMINADNFVLIFQKKKINVTHCLCKKVDSYFLEINSFLFFLLKWQKNYWFDQFSIDCYIQTGQQFEIDLDLLLAGSRREVCERSQGRMQAGA
jgi:hypothetical protein